MRSSALPAASGFDRRRRNPLTVVTGPEEAPVSVALCCATAEAVAVEETFGQLADLALPARSVSGVESDPMRLLEAMDETSGPCLFVICQSPDLGDAQVRQLVEIFTQHRGPMHRLLVVALESGKTQGLVSMIRLAARGVRRKLGLVEVLPQSTSSGMRDSSRDTIAHGSSVSTVENTGHRARKPTHKVVVSEELSEGVGPIEAHAPGEIPRLSDSVLSLVHADVPAIDPSAVTRTDGKRVDLEVVDGASGDDAAAANESPPVDARKTSAESTTRPFRPKWLRTPWLAFGGGVIGFVWGLVLIEALSSGKAQPVAEAHQQVVTPANMAADQVTPAQDKPVKAVTSREPSASESKLPLNSAPEAEPTLAAARLASVPPPPGDGEPNKLDQAIKAGKVRMLDLLVVLPVNPEAVDWSTAATRCRGRSAYGVRGWRLPTKREIKKLRRAKLAPEGEFWTMTKVLSADVPSNWVYVTSVRGVRSRAKTDVAQTLCVRKGDAR